MNSREIEPRALGADALVFAPHPDDEVLGCGGTMIRKSRAGGRLEIVYVTDGRQSHRRFMSPDELGPVRRAEARAAAAVLGASARFLDLPDGSVATQYARGLGAVNNLLMRTSARQIFVPYRHESPPDHSATWRIVAGALRRRGRAVDVYEYPVWFWHDWPWVARANCRRDWPGQAIGGATAGWRLGGHFRSRVEIADVAADKMRALECYTSQLRSMGGPGWPTLNDVGQGDFLRCFFRTHEVFHHYRLTT